MFISIRLTVDDSFEASFNGNHGRNLFQSVAKVPAIWAWTGMLEVHFERSNAGHVVINLWKTRREIVADQLVMLPVVQNLAV